MASTHENPQLKLCTRSSDLPPWGSVKALPKGGKGYEMTVFFFFLLWSSKQEFSTKLLNCITEPVFKYEAGCVPRVATISIISKEIWGFSCVSCFQSLLSGNGNQETRGKPIELIYMIRFQKYVNYQCYYLNGMLWSSMGMRISEMGLQRKE